MRCRWSAIRDLLHSKPTSELLSKLESDTFHNSFLDFFNNKIDNIKQSIVSRLAGRSRDPLESDAPYVDTVLSDLKPVSVDEVRQLISSMPPNRHRWTFSRRVSWSCMSIHLLHSSLDWQDYHLMRVVFHQKFKTASITPLLKWPELDRDSPLNYRPSSNLNTISKILKRLFFRQIQPHVNSSENFNNFQSAYRRHHSTETALVEILDDIYKAAGTQSVVILAALDVSAALHTLDDTTLINCLKHTFGITGVTLRWINSYVSERSQFVVVEQSKSNVTRREFEVPKVVLGPILFTLYVAPVANIISFFGVSHHQYADDSQLYIATNRDNIQTKLDLLRDCTTAVNDSFLLNGLSLNPDKSEVLLLGTAA